MVIGYDKRGSFMPGCVEGRGAILKADDLESLRGRNLFDHASDGRAAIDDKDGRRHLTLQFL
jgi:hypothetical protein